MTNNSTPKVYSVEELVLILSSQRIETRNKMIIDESTSLCRPVYYRGMIKTYDVLIKQFGSELIKEVNFEMETIVADESITTFTKDEILSLLKSKLVTAEADLFAEGPSGAVASRLYGQIVLCRELISELSNK